MKWQSFSPENRAVSEQYLDAIFGPGKGQQHREFLKNFEQHEKVLPTMDLYHLIAADTTLVDYKLHYLIGTCLLFTVRSYSTAVGMVKILLHLGMDPEKIRTTISRLSIWLGGFAATECMYYVNRAIQDYEKRGIHSLPLFAE